MEVQENNMEGDPELVFPTTDFTFDFSKSALFQGPDDDEGVPVVQHGLSQGTIKKVVPDYLAMCPEKEITTSDGQLIRLKPRKFNSDDDVSYSITSFNLQDDIGINIGSLLDKIEYNDKVKQAKFEELEQQQQQDQAATTNKQQLISNNILWAEKWRPKNFLELVGNEKTNRYALRWLRRWSKCVFGEKVVSDRVPFNNTTNTSTNSFQQQQQQQQKQYPHSQSAFAQHNDPFDRPEKRIMLIHGPPGIGKTTVAHVIAKQAGYEVMEINASDERAGQKVKDKIINSLNTQTFSGKPVVLICDEVDGSTESGFIRVLVDLIYQDQRATARAIHKKDLPYGSRNDKKSNKNNTSKLLLRPIICICNDLYAHSLEKLRPHSEIISFRKASERTVKERLREICAKEEMNIDSRDLSDIVAATNCDIRSCLNLLQFSGRRGGANADELKMKDSQINWFSIVKEIFKREPKKSKKDQYIELEKLVSANNHNDRVVNGLFSLYHDVEYQDDLMRKPNEIGDWVFFFDYMNRSSFELQNGEIGSYCAQVPMKFYLSFSDPNNNHEKNLKPKSDYEYYEARRFNMDVQKKFMTAVKAETRTKMILSNLATQMLPFIDHLLTPELKSQRFNLKSSDKKKIDDALAILNDLGLAIEPRRDDTFMKALALVPPIDEVTNFSAASKKQSLAKKTSVYPILLQEIDKIKHAKRKQEEDDAILEQKRPKNLSSSDSTATTTSTKSFTSTLDFFKNQYDDISIATAAKNKIRDEKSRIWVKYHEGFSNAVRKNITWDELWSF